MKKKYLVVPVIILAIVAIIFIRKNTGPINSDDDLKRLPGYKLYEADNARYQGKVGGFTENIYYESIFVSGESTSEEREQVAEYIELFINQPWDRNYGLAAKQFNLSFYSKEDNSLIENMVFRDGQRQEVTDEDVFYSADKKDMVMGESEEGSEE
ncbi:MAG: hypothetical protein K6G65_06655 [Lachnospiraceae bacterium]|nr:hypothetical protein [Lachnospiraceae bacterium]